MSKSEVELKKENQKLKKKEVQLKAMIKFLQSKL